MNTSEQAAVERPALDWERVLPVFALTFVDVLGLTVLLPLLHLYAAAFGATPLEVGLVAAAFPLAQLVGVPVMGALSDRFGRKPLLLISQITTCISFVLLGLANSLAMVVFSRLLDGLFGANLATAQAALTDVSDEKTRAQALGLTGAAFGLGFIFGPIISGVSLSFSDSLAMPAFIAAAYSFCSILLTLFAFKETLPPEKRGQGRALAAPAATLRLLRRPVVSWLLVLMFAQQVIFFGFESLLGLFTLSRLGLLGFGNSMVFLLVGVILVTVQVRLIGRWSRRFGERRLVAAALGLLALGLLLVATTPEQAHPFYVQHIVEERLREQSPTQTEVLLGEFAVPLPPDGTNGLGGVLWVLLAIIPVSVGAGLIRPAINSLLTRRVSATEYGGVLGISQSFVSAANACAPLLGGLIFQQAGISAPFLLGGLLMALLALVSAVGLREKRTT